jgi:hypothetical protein
VLYEGQSYSLKEIREAYAATPKVFRAWFRQVRAALYVHGYEPGQRMLTPRQVQVIMDQFGKPMLSPASTDAAP